MDTFNQLIRYALSIALMVPMLGAALIVAPISLDLSWIIARNWNRTMMKIFGIAVEVKFDSKQSQLEEGGVLVVLTQQSLMTPAAIISASDKRFMSISNIEYALIPFLGWLSFPMGWVIIKQWPEQAKRQLRKAVLYARDGGLVLISAEGKRSVDGELNPFKKGAAVLPIESQALIHPLYIAGARQCLPVGDWRIKPGKIVLHYLAPIPTKGLSYEDRNSLLENLRAVAEVEHAQCKQGNESYTY
ncbi:MAG: 1-acyl-sn-glycerol-3-phosphate acyltransferase [Yoonia sp.]|jgi:1-acyl-sn-glycerol-3-phosphate acyltransferase